MSKPLTVNEAIKRLQDFADEGYGDATLFVLAGPHDVRTLEKESIDEWFSNNAVWIRCRLDNPPGTGRGTAVEIPKRSIGDA